MLTCTSNLRDCQLTTVCINCRSEAMGLSSLTGRIGNLLAPFTSLVVRCIWCNDKLTLGAIAIYEYTSALWMTLYSRPSGGASLLHQHVHGLSPWWIVLVTSCHRKDWVPRLDKSFVQGVPGKGMQYTIGLSMTPFTNSRVLSNAEICLSVRLLVCPMSLAQQRCVLWLRSL